MLKASRRVDKRAGRPGRRGLLLTASVAAVVAGLTASPASAQLARLRGGAPSLADVSGTRVTTSAGRPANMREALARQQSVQASAAEMRSFVTSARQAALTATRAQPTNGLSERGLNPIAEVREAIRLSQTGNAADQAQADTILINLRAASDLTGKKTWDGANLPTQAVANGETTVTITQTQSRALLSWNRFDIGAQTTVQFNQKQDGVAQSDWTAVNRVVDSTDPTTILGKLKADGGVFILNQRGVIFGKGAQVNLRSLLASSLELGNYGDNASFVSTPGSGTRSFSALTLQQRNLAFLRNGLLPTTGNPTLLGQNTAPPLLLSPLLSGTISGSGSNALIFPDLEGDIIVDPGATITASIGGSIILAAPKVENLGILSVTEGQVSLVGGRLITFAKATGEASSRDPNIRGLYLRALGPVNRGPQAPPDLPRDNGFVINRGLIESRRGYLSLVTTPSGEILNEGLLAATTSVSRNGKISLLGGRVTIGGGSSTAQAGGIVILPDENGETIPQGSPDEPANFKRSQIEIGAAVSTDDDDTTPANESAIDTFGQIASSIFTMGENALIYAPNANVVIGRARNAAFDPASFANVPSRIEIRSGARIDVSGLKDVAVDSTRNFIEIKPVKRNELRDTPNYRDVAIGDEFTLNGLTLTVDIRRSGVRDDGVRWIGSPLIEAGSLASQIPVTVSELMTEGGDVSLSVNPALAADAAAIQANPDAAQSISIARNALIDFSGGWINYTGGEVRSSRLVTGDGRIVDIAEADPNDDFVSVFEGFTAAQPRFGVVDRFDNPVVVNTRFEAGYDEGRDAGSLIVNASATRLDGAVLGAAFAGERQIASARKPTARAVLPGDARKLQSSTLELPSGGYLRIGALSGADVELGGDIVVYRGSFNGAQSGLSQTLLSDSMLSNAGLSGLTLQTTGSIVFAGAAEALLQPGDVTLTGTSNLALASGGVLTLEAGRSIRFDGTISAPSGTIVARTTTFGSRITSSIVEARFGLGSIFRTDDDISAVYAPDAALPSPFDIIVNGTLTTAGRWVNDFATAAPLQGSAWIDGGSISLTVAPRVLVALGDTIATAAVAGDLSGSILINQGALLNVSAGGHISADRTFDLSGKGGDVSLINETLYAGTVDTDNSVPSGRSDFPLGGDNQTIGFTPVPGEGEAKAVIPSLVPVVTRSRVSIADGALVGFGFSGGGKFRLVSPDVSFGSDARRPGATHIGLDFAARTGFGGIDLTSNRSRIIPGLFDNGSANASAFRDTTSFRVRAGETLALSQSLLPQIATRGGADALLALATGGELLSILTPSAPGFAFDQRGVDFAIGGLGELVVERGGSILGAAEASITAPKLINSGMISLPGGSIRQIATAPTADVASRSLGVRSLAELLGQADADGRFDEEAANALGLKRSNGLVLTNGELFRVRDSERLVYFLGVGDETTGIRLDPGSVTDLSGTVLLDPRAPFAQGGGPGALTQVRVGRVLAGGSIVSESPINDEGNSTRIALARRIDAAPGAIVDLSGTRATLDRFVPGVGYVATAEWSQAGRIAALGGGSIDGAFVNAFGGYGDDGGAFLATGAINRTLIETRAQGGTIEWLRPTIRQGVPGGAGDALLADEIETSGFATLIARDGVTFDGAVDLSLGKAFLVTAAVSASGRMVADSSYVVAATSGTRARVNAPYISFASLQDAAPYNVLAQRDPGVANPGEVTFVAGSPGISFLGAAYFGRSIGTLSFSTPGDIRLVGVDARTAQQQINNRGLGALNGEIITHADTAFEAGRVYATTGTGNLQAFIDAERKGQRPPSVTGNGIPGYNPFLILASGDRRISFETASINTEAPLSAGSYVQVVAERIEQNGHVAAPLGRLEFGLNSKAGLSDTARINPALVFDGTESVNFGSGSRTSVSGGGVSIPYGTTLDLIEYYFTPLSPTPLTSAPTSELRIAGGIVDIGAGATVDLRGGGDVFAYEFVSGVGGSRDVLDRANRDAFSSNDYDAASGAGFQYPDRRQVFAIVPAAQLGGLAAFDPIYSADYGPSGPADLYGAQAGLSIRIDGAEGIPAGDYVLLPAHYALLPGAFRVVENVGQTAPAEGQVQSLRDGSIVVGGSYTFAGTGFSDSARRSFTVQSRDTFGRYSQLETTSGSKTIANAAEAKDLPRPRLPLDAARLVLSPLEALRVSGLFDTAAAAGGRGVEVDIAADDIVIAAEGSATTQGALTLFDATLGRLNAESLFIGGFRVANADGTTDLRVDANRLAVLSGAQLVAPEIILAVGNERPDGSFGGSRLVIEDGASLTATGLVAGALDSDYVIRSFDRANGRVQKPAGYIGDGSGSGSVVRVANGAERLIRRTGPGYDRNANLSATFRIEGATLSGDNLALDSTRLPTVDTDANLNARRIALSGDDLAFGADSITPALQAKLGAAERLTLRSPELIGFANGVYAFNDLSIDAPGVKRLGAGSVPASVTISARDVRLSNSFKDALTCFAAACGGAEDSLTIATRELAFGGGLFRTSGFGGDVTLSASRGAYVEGKGALDTGTARLSLTTPVLADRGGAVDPRRQGVRPDYAFGSRAGIDVSAPAGVAVPSIANVSGNRAPGARIRFGDSDAVVPGSTGNPQRDINITDALVLATAGVIEVRASGDVSIGGSATLATPGFTKTFGDKFDSVTVAASGGAVDIVSEKGGIALSPGSSLISDTGIGEAGAISLRAPNGAIVLAGNLNAGLTAPRANDFIFDSGTSAFDMSAFIGAVSQRFGGTLSIRSGDGDLNVGATQSLRAEQVSLTADGGSVNVAGTIDTSGVDVAGLTLAQASNARVNGGKIELYGQDGVALAATARLDTHTTGYADADARSASGGDVVIGIGQSGASLSIAAGARIDVGARRTQAALAAGLPADRMVGELAKAPGTLADRTVYRFVEADKGGAITLRAPLIGAGMNEVDIRLPSTSAFVGAGEIQIEAFRRYDLDAINNSGFFDGAGVGRPSDTEISLDPSERYNARDAQRKLIPYDKNLLSGDFVAEDGTPTIVNFVRNFRASSADGSSFEGIRVRPGVEFTSAGAISLQGQWNLAAASIDYEGAFAAGLIERIEPLGTRFGEYGLIEKGTPFYSVIAGKEGELLERFGNFFYRVGGKASGEAPIVRFRAGDDVVVARSINDGFFVFRDRSDQSYLDFQMGGGTRTYNPAVQLSCGLTVSPDCSAVATFGETIPASERNARSVRVLITNAFLGADQNRNGIKAPLSPEANSPAALGSMIDAATDEYAGASLAFGELFPLLSDGSAMRSSDIHLTAGVRPDSANPYHVNGGSTADVIVTDAKTVFDDSSGRALYRMVAAPADPRIGVSDSLQFRFARQSTDPIDPPTVLNVRDFFNQDFPSGSTRDGPFSFEDLTEESFAILTWGGPNQGAGFEAGGPAKEFFGALGREFVGPQKNPTGVIARFDEVLAFLELYTPKYLQDVAGGGIRQDLTGAPRQAAFDSTARGYAETFVRTGSGSISVSAARDVDLRDAPEPLYRLADGSVVGKAAGAGSQTGGTAIYTAGVRAAAGTRQARLPGGGVTDVSFDSPLFGAFAENTLTHPSPLLLTETPPVLSIGGGDVSIAAGRDVLGRRDFWSEGNRGLAPNSITIRDNNATDVGGGRNTGLIGAPGQAWRVGRVGADSEIGIAAHYFSSGVGALAGGDVTVHAGRNVSDLTVALDTSIMTAEAESTKVLITLGGGNLDLKAGGDLIAGRFDVTSGQARLAVGGDVAGLETLTGARTRTDFATIRIENATVDIDVAGSVAGLNSTRTESGGATINTAAPFALGASNVTFAQQSNAGLYSNVSAVDVTALGDIAIGGGVFAPPSLELASMTGGVTIGSITTLYPSSIGRLTLLAARDMRDFSIAMLDIDPSLLEQSAFSAGVNLRPEFELAAGFPGANATIDETLRRQMHNSRLTHAGDFDPFRIYSNGSIINTSINMPKAGSIRAGLDIVDMFFVGQNLRKSDETRIIAGRDITATTQAISGTAAGGAKPYFGANGFYLGGPGAFSIEAGRNLGPFITSANIDAIDVFLQRNIVAAYGGGIMTVGNEHNPWLPSEGADLNIAFGVAPGADYDGLRETYLSPSNLARLDGDLFVQFVDAQGNTRPDRNKPIYAPILARWLSANEPALFAAALGGQQPATGGAFDAAAYEAFDALYEAFSSLSLLRQRSFLVNELYFNELKQPSLPDGPSFQQYIRGYRAIEALFPARLGYTDNLAAYRTDPATIDADNPLGVPTRTIVNGQPAVADRVATGNADLRLATFQTARGGNINILAPGGDMLVGSVVRTSEQVDRRNTRFVNGAPNSAIEFGGRIPGASPIRSIPLGLEGILTLRGGAVRGFFDGDLRLNQSRLFTNAGGDITAWSSNGDLNAGQGPKSAANFPPVTVRFDLNGTPQVDTAGGIAGAGIGAFKQKPGDPNSTVILVAPVGEVDAGDAGVRASGDIFVAAARVANADNFAAGGTISGVPAAGVTAAPPPPSSAASSVTAQVARLADQAGNDDRRSVIIVDVTGYAGGDRCEDPENEDPDCPK